jgi:hypothetical protein
MADDVDALGGEVELRACAYCGAAIDPRCHRCSECGGHVGLAWKTVDSELFGMVFASVLIGIGCLVSWTQKRPADFTGISTVRGSVMLALAVYGIFSGTINILFRRNVVWPTLINAIIALWTGIGGIMGAMETDAWTAAGNRTDQVTFFEKYFGGYVRAIPPGFLLLTVGGALVMMMIVKGLVAGAGSASARAKAKEAARDAEADARKARRRAAETTPPPSDVPPSDVPPLPPV